MRCADFEQGLVELLEGAPDRDGNEARLSELQAHADACAECAGSTDLLQVLGLPRDERDPLPDPGHAYWDDFDRRLRDRIEEAPATAPSRLPRWISTAAAVLLLVVGGWVTWRLAPDGTPPLVAESDALPVLLEQSLAEAVPEEAMDHLDDLAGWTTWDEGELFPDVSDLDGDAREELLLWLREQSS